MEFSLRFADNETGHKDLVLRIGERSWLCGTYYFALDRGLLSGQEDSHKVRVVLRRLLKQWLFALENVSDGGTVYSPYDFSDQYTGWVRCQRFGNVVSVCRGWAAVEGRSFFPSSIGEYLKRLSGFRADDPAMQLPLTDLAEAIRDSIAASAKPEC